jgi:hypothetical protein
LNQLPAELSCSGSLLLASAFLLSGYCRKFTLQIKRRWHSLSEGVAVAYVFVNVMPELEEHHHNVSASAIGTLFNLEKRIYIWANKAQWGYGSWFHERRDWILRPLV